MAALPMAGPVIQLATTFVPGLNYGTAILVLVLLTLVHPAAAYDAGSLPLVADESICAVPPGIIASDGLDDVCLLAESCCPSWMNVPGTATLSSGANVDCGSAVCANICRMACDRGGTSEQCTGSPLCELTSTTEAYVFIRRNGGIFNVGHPAFGFRAAPGLYFYGALENPSGNPHLGRGVNNGFWMRNGTRNDMLCAMKNPPVGNNNAYDDDYKMFANEDLPDVCNAIRTAEDVYMLGYSVLKRNSLDAVFHVLTAYGIPGVPLPSEFSIPNDWYNNLDPATWTTLHIGTLSRCTSPIVTCSSSTTSTSTTSTSTTSISTTFTSTTSMSTTSTSTSTTSSMPNPTAGCSTCTPILPGENCCLLSPDSLAPTCVCGIFGNCSQFGSPDSTVFCPGSMI